MQKNKPFLASSTLFLVKRVFGLSGKKNKNTMKPSTAGMNGKANKQCHKRSFPLLNFKIIIHIINLRIKLNYQIIL